MTEIDKDFYCYRGFYDVEAIENPCMGGTICKTNCEFYRRKFPTPEQFKAEYGFDPPNDMAVYYRDNDFEGWEITSLASAYDDERYQILIACTPFVPGKDWRPE